MLVALVSIFTQLAAILAFRVGTVFSCELELTLHRVLQLVKILATNSSLPSLFCVPVLVKDNYDLVGTASTAGKSSCSCRHMHARRVAWNCATE